MIDRATAARVFVLTALLLSGCMASIPTAPQTVHLIYLGNLDGELEPCGCTQEGDLGGLLRQTTAIDQLRDRYPGLFLIHSGGLFNSTTATDRITSRFILSGMQAQNFDAVGLQWKDLAYGIDFIAEGGLPTVASNLLHTPFAREKRIRHGTTELAFFQWLDPAQSPYREMQGVHFPADADTRSLAQSLQQARDDGAMTVLSTTLSQQEAADRLPVALADIVVLQSQFENFAEPQQVGGTWYLQPGSRGQRLGSVELVRGASGRIEQLSQQIIVLPNTVADAPRLKAWYEAFTTALRADYKQRVAKRKALAAQPSDYVGDAACRACHTQAYQVWKESRHAHAFATLERVNKAFDANCLQCHTVAFNRPGGFVDPEITPSRLNVQCEVCHGPGKQHIATAGSSPLAKTSGPDGPVCLQCHNHNHSPKFDFLRYWPKIDHGLDTKTAAQ